MKPAALFLRFSRTTSLAIILGVALPICGNVTTAFAQTAPAAAPAAPAAGAATTATPAAGEAPVKEGKTFWHVIKEGGWIMFPLIGISMWCLALIIEGFIKIRLPNFAPPDLIPQIKTAFAEENFQQAWRLCKSRSTFLTNTLRHGLERIGRGRTACETAIAEHALKESMVYKTKISYLSTIGVVSPMVGLLGTVTGMIKAFDRLGADGLGNATGLAAAIGEVLIATATGLIVAIPAFFLFYFFKNRLQMVVVLAEDVMNQLMVDVKYEELTGVKIGESMEAEIASGHTPFGAGGKAPMVDNSKRVSQVVSGVTMACPQCNAPITAGAPKCANCGTELQWS